jgi:hypothetical protein
LFLIRVNYPENKDHMAIKSVIYAPEKEFGKKSFVVLKEVSF